MAVIYLAGPMTGIENYNYPAFMKAASYLRNLGHTVLNPAEFFDQNLTLPRAVYMKRGIENLITAEYVAVLQGWENSRGSQLEVDVARQCGLPVIPFKHFLPKDTLKYENLTLWD
jgi:hypothetical protein